MTRYACYLLWVGVLANPLAAYALPPVITLDNPIQTAAFSAPASIKVAVSASDLDAGGAIAKVEYFLGGVSQGSVTTPPFSKTLSSVAAGTYAITAIATDKQNEVAASNVVTVTVYDPVTGNNAPTVTFNRPSNLSTYSLNNGPVDVPVRIAATDPDSGGSVNRIDLLLNGVIVRSVLGGNFEQTYQFTAPGPYQLVGRAYDNFGITSGYTRNIEVSNAVAGNTPPTSILTSPVANGLYPPFVDIKLIATPTDGGSINRVEFYRDDGGVNTWLYTVKGAYTSYSYTMPGVTAGRYTFRARAYDNVGVYTDSPAVPIVVNTSPKVSITEPADNAVINAPATFNLLANATDADGNISKVEFYQGTTLLGEDTTYPYSWSLNNLPLGSYAHTAKVYDALGAVVTSNVTNVVVNELPTISLKATGALGGYNAPADIVLTADPADVDGTILKVEFYSESQLPPIYTAYQPPYSHTVVGAPAGTYTYTARVYDNQSAVTTSNPVDVTVSAALSPTTFTYDEMGRLIGVKH